MCFYVSGYDNRAKKGDRHDSFFVLETRHHGDGLFSPFISRAPGPFKYKASQGDKLGLSSALTQKRSAQIKSRFSSQLHLSGFPHTSQDCKCKAAALHDPLCFIIHIIALPIANKHWWQLQPSRNEIMTWISPAGVCI